jgi:hypothetical protein
MADVRVERGSGGLGGWPVKDEGDTCQMAGEAYGVHYSCAIWWFGPQNHRRLISRVWASKPGRRFQGRMNGTESPSLVLVINDTKLLMSLCQVN